MRKISSFFYLTNFLILSISFFLFTALICNQQIQNNQYSQRKTDKDFRCSILNIFDISNFDFIDLTIEFKNSKFTTVSFQPLSLSGDFRLYHVTSILHCHWKEFWSRDTDVYMFWYYFDIVVCQFLETGTPDRFLIGIVQLLRFSLYTPFHFFFTVP